MPIVIDEVVGTIPARDPGPPADPPPPPAKGGIDPRDLGRELRRMARRSERLRAD